MPEFQRLRWIEQTSYRVLYPAARHDRFIHSLGVFHLGGCALAGLKANARTKKEISIIEKLTDSFLLACLLHDFGHAPFSHTTEDFFAFDKKGKARVTADFGIGLNLCKCVNNPCFKKDFESCKKAPAPHEIISATLICRHWKSIQKNFPASHKKNISLEFTVRCVIGCTYKPDRRPETGIKDCLIRLLNSPTVDVDKLDYIARDANMSGYDNVLIDTDRLLRSVCYVIDAEGNYHPAFRKSALSVVENVISAKNAVAKWIVSHPVVIYERFLIRDCIGAMIRDFEKTTQVGTTKKLATRIFSIEALAKEGVKIRFRTGQSLCLRLLSDPDVIHLVKRNAEHRGCQELFDRSIRRRPIWKSREEFVHMCGGHSFAQKVLKLLAPLVSYVGTQMDEYSETAVLTLKDIEKCFERTIGVYKAFATQQNANSNVDFVLLLDKNSFDARIDPEKTYIRFSNSSDFSPYGEIVVSGYRPFGAANKEDDKNKESTSSCLNGFFYLYTHVNFSAHGLLKSLVRILDQPQDKPGEYN